MDEVFMTKEESYADRRLLFKDIWQTAMLCDEKDADIMAKPKVIKTLRVDETDKYMIGKRKKERLKNLRTVCKKILEFCNRQDAEDIFYEKVVKGGADGYESDGEELPKFDFKRKKGKTYHRKKKIKRTKSLFAPKKRGYQTAKSERNVFPRILTKNSSRHNSPVTNKRIFVQRASVTHRVLSKAKSNPDGQEKNSATKRIATSRKVLRKKRTKRKKAPALNLNPPGPSGAPPTVRCLSQPKTGRVIVKSIKQFLTDNKIEVT